MADRVITLSINGAERQIDNDPRQLLVDVVREHLDLKATHIGCLSGDCGACSVIVDGEVRKSCLSLAVSMEGAAVRTLDGWVDDVLVRLQSAFISTNAFQCGFCTSGMLMAAYDLLRRNPCPDTLEIRKAISGNLCRCTGYEPIIQAIQQAIEK
ncbi:(2Fe-2S)-binding protein [Rhizobium leguminosarum]|uniref:(2Fe-2S)-binding protein n=1 Tax=Rhizobium leguminosarum TaxID=384 RepID=UPI00143FA3CB|nr:(2Fe-2S)-binding protein [Rhizobium leguminosarum]NKL23925.1 2Fe-2S iron-sulfur cluster binding domain-containing protein [Rhizobium leguminosarum bv. viciae]